MQGVIYLDDLLRGPTQISATSILIISSELNKLSLACFIIGREMCNFRFRFQSRPKLNSNYGK